jgi:non-specific serine/threonine protein kinase
MSEPASQIGPYQVLDRIGRGGMGEVFRARDTRLERIVALKLLPAEMAADTGRLGLFRREALALAALNHPNLATIHGLEPLPGGGLAIVLEFLAGGTLGTRLERGPLPAADALALLGQVADAMAAAHAKGVVHRDLKPANIMFGEHGHAKVMDFGLARREGDASTPGAMMGSPGYMSPEQALGEPHDARTDVFSFGCVLYECLCGRRAFPADDAWSAAAAVLNEEPDLAAVPADVPPGVRELLERCLRKAMDERPADMGAVAEALAATRRAPEPASRRRGNLPRPATRFIGRARAREEAAGRLAESRLLTLTGVGGCGKTRLALQVAEDAESRYADGAWFVDLAPLAHAARLPEAMLHALGLQEEPGLGPEATAMRWLRGARALVLLDNCEHLLEACHALAQRLLAECPGVCVLATSRERLGVEGESVWAVGTLDVPPPGRRLTAARALEFDAVELFVARARQASASFAFEDLGADAVAEVCRRLDGIPLAIELAAARTRALAVEAIRSRLDDRFRLLTGGSRDALTRQQTLLATLEWSYDHLLAEEQQLFARLAVFAGGWTIESARGVCGHDVDEFDFIDRLTRLVDKSLVLAEPARAGETRYRMLETVRQFAAPRLDAAAETATMRDRHLAVGLALAEASERRLMGPEEARTLATLDAERDNLMAALAWSATRPEDALRGLRLALALWRYWSTRGLYDQGRRAIEDALRRAGEQGEPALRANAHVRAGGFALYQGDYLGARPHIEAGLELARSAGDRKGIARALSGLATTAIYQADIATARRSFEESLALYEALGEKRGVALAQHNLGYVAWCAGDPQRARHHLEIALARLHEVGDRQTMALTLSALGGAWTLLGEPGRAAPLFAASLGMARELGAHRESAYALEGVGQMLAARGDAAGATRLLGAAEALRETLGSPPLPIEGPTREALRASLVAVLGEAAHAKALEAGRAVDVETAIEAAMRAMADLPPKP